MTAIRQPPITRQTNKFELTDEQQSTVALLKRLLGRAVSDRYIDFCRLSAGAFEIRVASPLAGHALRELESILRQTLAPPFDGTAKVSDGEDARLTIAANQLRSLNFDDEAIERALDELRPRVNHKEQIRKIAVRLGLAPDGDIATAWIALHAAHKKAHERPFHKSLAVDDEFREKWADPFHMVIRGISIALQGKYTTLMARVEELAAMSDRNKAVSLFEREIPGALPLQSHFFRNLQGPGWLPVLLKRGLIREPVATAAEDGDDIGLRQWPVGRYLLEMAKSNDAATRAVVAHALKELAAATHPDVRRDGLEIIAALPPPEIVKVVELVEGWLKGNSFFFGTHFVEQILSRLIEAKEKAACLRVAAALYRVFDTDGQLATHFSAHMYEHSLFKMTPMLTDALGIDGLKLFSGLLNEAAIITKKISAEPPTDYTIFTSFPLPVTEADQHDVFGSLTAAVLLSSMQLIEDEGVDGLSVMGVLRKKSYRVYRRIALYVLARRPEAAPSIANDFMFDAEFMELGNFNQEYADLAKRWFPSMATEKQGELLAKIDGVPEKYRQIWRKRFCEHYKREPNPDEEKEYEDTTVRDLTWYWREVLPAERQKRLEEFVSRRGDPEAWRNSMIAEEKSPFGPEEFETKGAIEIAGRLRTWAPDATLPKHTRTALGVELRRAVEKNPLKFSSAATAFSDLPPLYTRRLIEGLRQSVQNKTHIDWGATLKLIEGTIGKVQGSSKNHSPENGDDPTFFWAAKEAAELIRSGLLNTEASIELEHAQQVQSIILDMESVAPDAPELEDFEERFKRNAYFGSEATLYGLVAELNFLLVYWLSNQKSSPLSDDPKTAITQSVKFKEFAHRAFQLSGQNGRIARAIFGRYLSWLIHFGEDWVRKNFTELFPNSSALREAAWLGHLLNDNRPTRNFVEGLRPCYEEEFARIKANTPMNDRDFRQERCCEYVLVLYIWGVLPEDLLEAFLASAPPRLRRHAMSFVGRELKSTDMSEEARARAMGYWERRLSKAPVSPNKDDFREELSAIGMWASFANVDSIWLLDQQTAMYKQGFTPSDGFGIVDWASKVVSEHPDKTIEMVEALITKTKIDQWTYMSNQNALRKILTAGLVSQNDATHESVQNVISYLASMGDSGFLDLAKK